MKSAYLRQSTPKARAKAPVIRKCKACGNPFAKQKMGQKVCDWQCGLVLAARERERVERVSDRERKKALERRSDVLAQAKVAIQRFRRLEELSKGRGCMSCQRTQDEVKATDGWKPGGVWDGGHFIGKGARPELALEPLNIWLQCKSCNGGSGKYARKGYTVNKAFRENLIATEGQELVDWLEGPHEPKKYTTDELRTIRDTYRAKTRQLKALG